MTPYQSVLIVLMAMILGYLVAGWPGLAIALLVAAIFVGWL